MIMTIFRSTFAKSKSKTFYYHCYKKLNLEQFQIELNPNKAGLFESSFFFFLGGGVNLSPLHISRRINIISI